MDRDQVTIYKRASKVKLLIIVSLSQSPFILNDIKILNNHKMVSPTKTKFLSTLLLGTVLAVFSGCTNIATLYNVPKQTVQINKDSHTVEGTVNLSRLIVILIKNKPVTY